MPATLSPAPMKPVNQKKKQTWWQRLLRIEYFVIALIIHSVLLLGFGGKVLFDAIAPKNQFDGSYLPPAGPAESAPPAPQETPPEPQETVPVPVLTPTAAPDVIANDVLSPDSFTVALPNLSAPSVDAVQKTQETLQKTLPKKSNFAARAAAVREFTKDWMSDANALGAPRGGPDTKATFVCFLAKAGGIDPTSYHVVTDNKIVAGPITNLLFMINAWSKGNIKADAVPEPLDLSSNVIFEKKPPFIYFAGYKDFILTDKEIDNLRRYLTSGGAIWGDNGLAGIGSRFDLAFRREMKRVLPDEDKPFEILPLAHPVFQGPKAFFQLKELPSGMNYRNDPIEVIKIDDEIAVIYTLNNYTDMMQAAYARPVKASDNQIEAVIGKQAINKPWATWRLWGMTRGENRSYFRNFDVESTEMSYRLSINIIVHLLTRFQEKLLLAP